MSFELRKAGLAALIVGVARASTTLAADGEVVIGNLDDLSGVYSDDGGPGSVEAEKMAIADFGGTVLGRKIVALVADHQNKPDIGASRFREWADQKGLNMMIAGANTGVTIAMAKVAVAKKIPLLIVGAGGSSLTNEDCTAYSVHYVFDTTALANGTASTVLRGGGKSWFYVTADYAFGTQLMNSASKVVEASGGRISVWCACRCRPLTSRRSCCRHRARVPRCSPSPMPVMTSRTRSRRRGSSALRRP